MEEAAAKAYELGAVSGAEHASRRSRRSVAAPPAARGAGRWRKHALAAGFLAPAAVLPRRLDRLSDDPHDLRSFFDRSRRRVRRARQLQDALHDRHPASRRSRTTSLWVAVVPALVTAIGLDLRRAHRADPLVASRSRPPSSCRWRSRSSPRASSGGSMYEQGPRPRRRRTPAIGVGRGRRSARRASCPTRSPSTDDSTGSRRAAASTLRDAARSRAARRLWA